MRHVKKIASTLLLCSLLFSCNSSKTFNEESRLKAINELTNFTWNYHTEIEEVFDDGSRRATIYDGEGQVTETDVMTIESMYVLEIYPLDDVIAKKEEYPEYTLDEYVEEFYGTSTATYVFDLESNLLKVKKGRGFAVKSCIIQDGELYEYSVFYFYDDGTIEMKVPTRFCTKAELESSIKNYIPMNKALFEEVINKDNKINGNTYSLANPKSDFYFANTGVFMTAHQINRITLTFDKNTITNINYLNDTNREVNVTISNIGSTVVEPPYTKVSEPCGTSVTKDLYN